MVSRFRVPEPADVFRVELERVRDVLAAQAGYVDGAIGRNLDDPELWLLQTRWRNVGSYRRALSAYEVKVSAVPLLSQAIDEPSAYEVVGRDINVSVPRETG